MANVKGGASGALSGAASGAAIGSVVPVLGTAIGAIGGGLIGGISGLFGGGDDTPAAAAPPIVNPVTGAQINQSTGTAQDALTKQQAFLAALQGQNGIGNQSQVYNQLQGVANGTGPNPALAALHQATAQNVAQQGALQASQRGVGANPALLARQAAMQGANIQQQSAGQAATLEANQSLSALGQLSGVAQNQVTNEAQATTGLNTAAEQEQANLLGAQGQFNSALTAGQGSVNSANAPLNLSSQQYGQNLTGGLLSGAGAAATALGGKPSAPGITPTSTQTLPAAQTTLPTTIMAAQGGMITGKSKAFQHLSTPNAPKMAANGGMAMFASGGKVKALVSPGEKYLNPKEVKKVADGKKSAIKAGEKIPGKPKVGGAKNSYSNDVIRKDLDEGGIVLPRSVTQAKDPAQAAHAFVSAIIAKQGLKGR